jgi:2-phospho-L-lactate guanylyltransferase
VYIIIPAKPFDQSKSRLAPVLSATKRANLSRMLLRRTVRLARSVGQVVVISRDPTVRQVAKEAGAWALVEAGKELNAAIRQALEWIVTRDGRALLVLPNDLPFLRRSDLSQIAKLGHRPPAIVIAPCHRTSGTNALYMQPPRLIEAAFGTNSFERHQQAAAAVGVEPFIYHSPTIAFDVDYPEDLQQLCSRLPRISGLKGAF